MSLSYSDPNKSEVQLICEYCGNIFISKELLTEHLSTHTDKSKKVYFYCKICLMLFKNKGLLCCHMKKKHINIDNKKITNNNTVLKKRAATMRTCVGCKKEFRYKYQLEYHIRKEHYNLISKPPYCALQDINQEWYEKVLNKNIYAELKKYNANTLFIRKVEDLSITPLDVPRDLIDLRLIYPTEASKKWFPCAVCSKFFCGKDLRDHVSENHSGLVKEMCVKCHCWYEPLTSLLDHVCPM